MYLVFSRSPLTGRGSVDRIIRESFGAVPLRGMAFIEGGRMKTELTMALIKRLRLDSKPVSVDAQGDLVFEPNPSGKDYIVYDASQEAPPGFGVRVAKKKTFIVRRKVHGKSFMPTVGNVADFMADTKSALSNARAKAAKMALEIVETKTNPNETARKRSAAELTPNVKNEHSHRARAFGKLIPVLETLLEA